jgi:hypothetical protein
MEDTSFADISIVSCGTMSLEIRHLQNQGFLDTAHTYYTTPGLHQNPAELERQVVRRIKEARENTGKVIVIYGGKFCYVNTEEPLRRIQNVIGEIDPRIVRINATHCMDMLASEEQRNTIASEIAGGEPVWWMTPGWIKFRHEVFKGWDKALANENFPRHGGGAVVLDGIGYMDDFMAERPEEFLEYSDWMGIPLIPYTVTLDRFKKLLCDQAAILAGLDRA